MRRLARLAAAAVLACAACRHDGAAPRALPVPGEDAPRVTVEVLNASGRAGYARIATRVLREHGIDVVSFGNAAGVAAPLDSTRILVRRGPAAAGERIRRALGAGRVVLAADTTLLLDASVLIGMDFVAPPELHP